MEIFEPDRYESNGPKPEKSKEVDLNTICIVENWAKKHGLELATEKCTSIIFTRKNKYELPNIKPRINGVNIQFA